MRASKIEDGKYPSKLDAYKLKECLNKIGFRKVFNVVAEQVDEKQVSLVVLHGNQMSSENAPKVPNQFNGFKVRYEFVRRPRLEGLNEKSLSLY